MRQSLTLIVILVMVHRRRDKAVEDAGGAGPAVPPSPRCVDALRAPVSLNGCDAGTGGKGPGGVLVVSWQDGERRDDTVRGGPAWAAGRARQ